MADTPAKLIIIDDEIQILSMLEKFFSRTGKFDVTTYSDPVEGLNAVLRDEVDIVLLDIMIPRMDGIEVLDRIRSHKSGVKVIMMTALSTLDRVLKSHKIGAGDYIMKPFESLSALEEKLSETL